MKDAAAWIAVVLTFAGYLPYIRDSLAKRTTPHVFTWFIWALVTAIACALQIGDGAGASSLVTAAAATACFAIFLIALRSGTTEILRSDVVCLALSLLAVGAWLIADSPVVAITMVALADLIAFVPTVRKSYRRPEQETLSSYVINTVRFCLAVYALEAFTYVTSLYPLTWVFANGLFSIYLLVRRRQVRNAL